ncbi:MAG: hypothetical protein V8K32_12440 [Candidatus Electrothrix gigas]
MNYFFGNNGYRIVDRAAVKVDDITFANIWGPAIRICTAGQYRRRTKKWKRAGPFTSSS